MQIELAFVTAQGMRNTEQGFLGGSGKEPTGQCRRHKRRGFDPCMGRSPGGENGDSVQYSCLKNYMDRGV